MQIRVFTLSFDDIIQGFDNEVIDRFCMNKNVIEIKSEFFMHNKIPYCYISVLYTHVLKDDEYNLELSEAQKVLYDKLREWRVAKAKKEGFPVFMVCKNKQLHDIVSMDSISLERLKQIKGFGKVRIQKYGKEIVDLVKAFYRKQAAPDGKNTTTENEGDPLSTI